MALLSCTIGPKPGEGEEQRRLELLLEHTDVQVFLDDMKDCDAPAPEG